MGAHQHHHGGSMSTPRAGERHRPRLVIAFILTLCFVVVQTVASIVAGSLALLSDAAHMLTDTVGLGLALAAITLASRSARRGALTFGWYRLEVLAALANAVLLLGVSAFVLIAAIRRLGSDVLPESGLMLVVAGLGLLINVVAMLLLREGARESLNLRAAYVEVLGDLLGSAAVLVGAVVIGTTGWVWVDPVIAVVIALLILPRAIGIARQSLRILVEAAPLDVDPADVEAELAALAGVVEVHDFHVWTLTSEMNCATVHLVVSDGTDTHQVLDDARRVMRDDFKVAHATVQIEPSSHSGCVEVDW